MKAAWWNAEHALDVVERDVTEPRPGRDRVNVHTPSASAGRICTSSAAHFLRPPSGVNGRGGLAEYATVPVRCLACSRAVALGLLARHRSDEAALVTHEFPLERGGHERSP